MFHVHNIRSSRLHLWDYMKLDFGQEKPFSHFATLRPSYRMTSMSNQYICLEVTSVH